MSAAPPKGTFATLDAIRGLAAFCVMGFHYALLDRTIPVRFSNAFIDVDLFFCLSGFVLMQAYGDWAERSRGIVGFLKIRLVRLYPMYFAGMVTGIAAFVASSAPAAGSDIRRLSVEVVSALLMLPDLGGVVSIPFSITDAIYPFDVPAWSLFFEILANIALVARRWDRAALMILAAVAGVALVAVCSAMRTINGGFEASTMIVGLLRVSYNFTVGALLMRLYQSGVLARFVLPPILPILGTVVISAVLPSSGPLDLVIVLIVVPLVIASATRDPRSERGLAVCAWLGRISYPLYAIHYPLVLLFLQAQGPHANRIWLIGACAVVAVILSDCLGRTLDPMVRQWLSRALRNKTALMPT